MLLIEFIGCFRQPTEIYLVYVTSNTGWFIINPYQTFKSLRKTSTCIFRTLNDPGIIFVSVYIHSVWTWCIIIIIDWLHICKVEIVEIKKDKVHNPQLATWKWKEKFIRFRLGGWELFYIPFKCFDKELWK